MYQQELDDLFEGKSHVDLSDKAGRRLIKLVLQKTGVKRPGTSRGDYSAALQKAIEALPRSPEVVLRGFEAVPPAETVLGGRP